MENEERYMQFPLCLLQEIPKSPKETIEKMIGYGVYYYAKSVKFSMDEVVRQLLFDYARNKPALKYDLLEFMEQIIDNETLCYDAECLFNGAEFDPGNVMNDELQKILEDYPEQKQFAIEHLQNHKSVYFFGLNNIDRSQRINHVQKLIEKHESMYGKQPMPSLNKTMLFSFRDNPQNIELLMAFVAIKSLIGQHKFTATNREIIVCRMIGAKSKEALEYALKTKELKELYSKYINRYWFDKLITELLTRNFLSSKIGFKRKIYLSTVYNYENLAFEISKFLKERDQKRQEKQAKKIIEQHLYNTTAI
ncbi:MAG: hypothetical protein AB7S50_08200 [Bacteroidales bacterium]